MGKKPKATWSQGQYSVQKIIDSRFNSQKKLMQYKVKWVGYPYDQCTWEPNQNLQNVQDMVEQFMKLKRKKLRQNKNKNTHKGECQEQDQSQFKQQRESNKMSAEQETSQKKRKIIYKSKIQRNTNQNRLINSLRKSHSLNQINKVKNSENDEQIEKYLSNNINSAERMDMENQLLKNQKQFQQKKQKHSTANQFYLDEKSQNSAEKSFQILGMTRSQMNLLFHICQNRVQKWVNRSQIIDKRARQICEFYQQNLVFLREENQKGMMD